jgi:hypothetical protein
VDIDYQAGNDPRPKKILLFRLLVLLRQDYSAKRACARNLASEEEALSRRSGIRQAEAATHADRGAGRSKLTATDGMLPSARRPLDNSELDARRPYIRAKEVLETSHPLLWYSINFHAHHSGCRRCD